MQEALKATRLELSEEHARWLEDVRQIPSELAAAMGIVTYERRITFEYRRGDELLWRQMRIVKEGGKSFACYAPDGRTLKDAGIALSFWNENDLLDPMLRPETPRIITEGQFDAASFKVAGAQCVVSVPNGAVDRPGQGDVVPAEDHQFAYLWEGGNRHRGFDSAQVIILATDADKAGRVLRDELALRLGRDRCWFVTYPTGCKDANEVLVKFGQDKGSAILNAMIADATPIVPSKLEVYSRIPLSRREVVHCGWSGLEKHLKIARPSLIVLSGPPGDGKSQFALAVAANLAYYHQWPGAILQFEDDVDRNREDLRTFWEAKHDEPKERTERAEAAAAWMDRYFRTIAPNESDEDRYDLSWLKTTIAEAAIRHRCRWVIIDPWNEIEHLWSKGLTETQYLNDALREMKRLARRYQIVLMIVTHPDKLSGRLREIEQWDLYSISGGQAWNNKADHGIIVLRHDRDSADNRNTFIKVSKSKRHATMGRPGTVVMRFVPSKATYDFVGEYDPNDGKVA